MNNEMKNRLSNVGAGFCLAPWTQLDLFLPNGVTRACSLPAPYKIPVSEVKQNPNALFNSDYIKNIKRTMLSGGYPKECEFCWEAEINNLIISERILRSSSDSSEPYFDEIVQCEETCNFTPKYLQIGFSNVCNFKCAYCSMEYSTKWAEEINNSGIYYESENYNSPMSLSRVGKTPILDKDNNDYIKAFWTLWPNLYRSLHTFRISGGEPLLGQDTWDVLDYIINEPNPNRNLNLAINSNFCVGDILIDKLLDKLEVIINENRVNQVILYISNDTWGKQAEYIRNGLNNDEFWNNVNKTLTRLPKISIVISATYTLLSVFGYDDLIKKIYDTNIEFNNGNRFFDRAVTLDSNYLVFPEFLSVKILTPDLKELILSTYNNLDPDIENSMLPSELNEIKTIYDWSKNELNEVYLYLLRKSFVSFIDEQDLRRGTNFLLTFPELTEFYNNIKNS